MSFLQAQGILPEGFELGVDLSAMDDGQFLEQLESAESQIVGTLNALNPQQSEQYTLSPGDVRFEGDVPIAAVPEATATPAYGTDQLREGGEYVTRRTVDGSPDMSPAGVLARSPISEGAPTTTVNLGEGRIPDVLVKSATDLSDKADTLLNQVSEIQNFRDMVENADTGALVPVTLPIQAAFQDIGIALNDQLPLLQALQAQQNQMALRLRNPDSGFGLTGNTSNQDIRFLKDSVAGVEKTPEANRAILTIMLAKQRREGLLAAAKSDYIWNNGNLRGWNETRQQIVDATPLFTEDEKSYLSTLQMPRVTSQTEYNELPSGTLYIDPEGNQRRKR
jgi:hypothetical protein